MALLIPIFALFCAITLLTLFARLVQSKIKESQITTQKLKVGDIVSLRDLTSCRIHQINGVFFYHLANKDGENTIEQRHLVEIELVLRDKKARKVHLTPLEKILLKNISADF